MPDRTTTGADSNGATRASASRIRELVDQLHADDPRNEISLRGLQPPGHPYKDRWNLEALVCADRLAAAVADLVPHGAPAVAALLNRGEPKQGDLREAFIALACGLAAQRDPQAAAVLEDRAADDPSMVAAALGYAGDVGLQVLLRLVDHESAEVRRSAATVLGERFGQRARAALPALVRGMLEDDPDGFFAEAVDRVGGLDAEAIGRAATAAAGGAP